MKAIWKYLVPVEDEFTVRMPKDARVLSVAVQREQPAMWVWVDPDGDKETRTFAVIGTGHEIEEGRRLIFLGTFQLMGGSFVGHLFEVR